MNLCSHKHDEVCYENNSCPVCELISEMDNRIKSLEGEVKDLEEKVEELESESN